MAARHPYKRGEVVLVQFPLSGPGGTKDRPAVVVSTDNYHDDWDELQRLNADIRKAAEHEAENGS